MAESICKEIKMQSHYLQGEELDTIYFGGGTPSILKPKYIDQILSSGANAFNVNANTEITLEANPDDLTLAKLRELKSLGINRLSIGIQSFHDKTLRMLNRAHNSNDAVKCIQYARDAGFENISIDLIFSIPGQSLNDLEEDLRQLVLIDPEHISVYSLTIEEKTVFGNWHKKGKFNPISDKKSADQFELIISMLSAYKYEQYEISNFCKNSFYAKHNTSYWKNIKYLGVGPGAHSYNRISRQSNIANNQKYMKSIASTIVPCEVEYLSNKNLANELLLTSLRTKWGCNLQKLLDLYNYDLLNTQKEKISGLTKEGYIILENGIIYLTKKGKFVADSIISDLFQA